MNHPRLSPEEIKRINEELKSNRSEPPQGFDEVHRAERRMLPLGCAVATLAGIVIAGSALFIHQTMEKSLIEQHYENFHLRPVREGYIDASSKEALRSQIKHEIPLSTQRDFHGQMHEIDKAYMKILLELNPDLHDHLVKGEGFMGKYRELDDDNLFGYSSATR